MQAKDYYKILNVTSDAGAKEIKTSYRKLALKYHPDKASNNPLAEARFKEIQEAYSILSNQKKKREYDRGFTYMPVEKAPATPQNILGSFIKLNHELAAADAFRLNREGLYNKIEKLLTTQKLKVLNESSDHKIKREIINEAVKAAEPLSYLQAEKICNHLQQIAGSDHALVLAIAAFLTRKKHQLFWDKYKIVAAIIIALLLCFFIFRAASRG